MKPLHKSPIVAATRKTDVKSPSSTLEINADSSEDRWRFQLDILRSECSFLRTEREVAIRKLERNRAEMESAFRSTLETMIAGRMDVGMGRIASVEKIQPGVPWRRGDVDRRASGFRRRVKGGREIDGIEFSNPAVEEGDDEQVEKLRDKMEGLSRGMRERVEERGMLFRLFNYGAATAGGNSRRLPLRETVNFGFEKETEKLLGLKSCCKCKELVEKIIAQVMSEADDWAEMQAMLEKVKIDMENLRFSRDQWERRAISSELNLTFLHSQIREWKKRAIDSEKESAEIRERIAQASTEAEAAAAVFSAAPILSDQLQSGICRLKQLKFREKQQKSIRVGKEKRVVGCRLIGLKSVDGFPRRRPPLQEMGNLGR